jgi:tetratricopeptide (TPR) repeat protein
MDDRSVHASTIRDSVVISGDGNTVFASFGDSGARLALNRRQVRPPDRRGPVRPVRRQVRPPDRRGPVRPGDPPRELDLFAPDAEALPLIGREPELAALRAWLDDPRDLSVHGLIGQAGSGKTRLALELCRAVDPADGTGAWRAAFVSPSAIAPIVETLVTRHFAWDRPTLLVLDYASVAFRALGQWLDALAAATQAPKLRFLLLEREAPEGFGWWHDLSRPSLHSEADRAALFLKPYPDRLPGLADIEERRALLRAARAAAHGLRPGGAASPPVPAAGAEPAFDRVLGEARFGNPLNLVMAGLLARDMPPLGALGPRRLDAAIKLADRELVRLERIAAPSRVGRDVIRHMAAFNGLVGGLPEDGLVESVRSELAAWGGAADARSVAVLLEQEFPGRRETAEAAHLATTQPDLIGEAVIVRAFEGAPSLGAEAIPTVRRAYALGRGRAAEVLVRVVRDFAHALEDRDSSEADQSRGKAVMHWMTALAEDTTDVADLLPLVFALPEATLVLREAAAKLTARIADRLVPRARVTDDDGFVSMSAAILNNLGVRLGSLGRREEGLAAAEEAVRLCRGLAATRPDAFTPYLAASLSNLATVLSDLGRREEALIAAEESVQIRRTLAVTRPDVFTEALARSLWVVGDLRVATGDHGAGIAALAEGVERLTPLFDAFPEAMRGMMIGVCQSYIKACEGAGRELDAGLLGPVIAIVQRQGG